MKKPVPAGCDRLWRGLSAPPSPGEPPRGRRASSLPRLDGALAPATSDPASSGWGSGETSLSLILKVAVRRTALSPGVFPRGLFPVWSGCAVSSCVLKYLFGSETSGLAAKISPQIFFPFFFFLTQLEDFYQCFPSGRCKHITEEP